MVSTLSNKSRGLAASAAIVVIVASLIQHQVAAWPAQADIPSAEIAEVGLTSGDITPVDVPSMDSTTTQLVNYSALDPANIVVPHEEANPSTQELDPVDGQPGGVPYEAGTANDNTVATVVEAEQPDGVANEALGATPVDAEQNADNTDSSTQLLIPPTITATPIYSMDVTTDCPFPVSDGDLASGVQLVGDPACVTGGLGCLNNVCRYCKFWESEESKGFMTCAELGYDFGLGVDLAPVPSTTLIPTLEPVITPVQVPAPAPVPPAAVDSPSHIGDTNCPYPVSDSDFAAGIQLVGDSSCSTGGLGCYQDVCRFCKFRNTLQSRHMLTCTELGYTRFGTAVTDSNGINTTDCPFDVPVGDEEVGIKLFGDVTCVSGGLGCFRDVCRYCKVLDTPQSEHLLNCSDIMPGVLAPTDIATEPTLPQATEIRATLPPTTKPLATVAPVTETVVTAPPTIKPLATVPPVTETVVTAPPTTKPVMTLSPTTKPAVTVSPTKKPVASVRPITKTVGTTPPATKPVVGVPTSVPTVATPTSIDTNCPYPVSDGNIADGIQLVGDETCSNSLDNVGCVQNICRYCKFTESPQSSHMKTCASLGYTFDPSMVVLTAAPIGTSPPAVSTAPVVTLSMPVTTIPAATTPITTVPPATRTVMISNSTSTDNNCPFAISDGDFAVGIQLVGDTTCDSTLDNVGCFQNVCRYCKFNETAQSHHLKSCASLGYNVTAAMLGTTLTLAVTSAPAIPAVTPTETAIFVPAGDCPYVVSDGDFKVGIKLVGDATCVNGGVGCFESVCRYCKYMESPQSAHLLKCTDYKRTSVTPTTTLPLASSPVPVADAPQPVPIVVGDIGTHPPTVVSPTNNDVADVPALAIITTAPIPATTAPRATIPKRCDGAAAPVDVEDGIDVVLDTTCTNDDKDCVPNTACRYCQRWYTTDSAKLLLCDDIQPVVRLASLASTKTEFEFFQDETVKVMLTAFACVGLVAVVVVVILGTKYSFSRRPPQTEEEDETTITPGDTMTTQSVVTIVVDDGLVEVSV